MTRLMRGTQHSMSSSSQAVEDSQDVFGSSDDPSCEDPVSQILDADGYFRVPSSHPPRSAKPGLVMEGSQDAGDNMEMLMDLCSGQFADGTQGGGSSNPASGVFDIALPSSAASGGFDVALSSSMVSGGFDPPSSTGFEGLFDHSSQSQSDRGSVASLFDSSSQSQHTLPKDSDSTSQSEVLRKRFVLTSTPGSMEESADSGSKELFPSQAGTSGKGPMFPSSGGSHDMEDILPFCSGKFSSSNNTPGSPQRSVIQEGGRRVRGVKRRLLVAEDSDEEEGNTGPFLMLSDEEPTKASDKNELSGSDSEDHNSDAEDEEEEEPSFTGFKSKGKLLQQFVEQEAELSGSEEGSDEDLDLAEDEDFMEEEAGDSEVLNQEQLRDQVGRAHMKQLLDDDDRQLMRYKEMYLPDGDLTTEGGGRHRRFHWKHLGDEESQNDLFGAPSDEEKEVVEDADEKQWRMERFEREKFLQSQQEDGGETGGDDDSQFMKFGQFFMKKQVSDPGTVSQQPVLARPRVVRSQSVVDKTSPAKFLKPKVPKRGSFLARSRENLAHIAEVTKGGGLNVNGRRATGSFVFSVNSNDKGDSKGEDSASEQLLNKAAAKAPAARKATPRPPPTKKQCVRTPAKSKKQKSIFKLLDK